jgi:peptidoglycan/xylan/chitin deacetylase (PgdA/CDA1 family)
MLLFSCVNPKLIISTYNILFDELMNKFISLTFDLEEFLLPTDFGKEIESKKMFQVSRKGSEEIKKILRNFNVKATLFVTENFALNFPQVVREFAKEGHEIALHAMNFWDLKLLAKEKKTIESICKNKVVEIRTHKLRLPSFAILKRIGFKYDNSLHPTYVPGRYNNLACPRKPVIINDILEVPTSVTPFLRLPFSFVWFRNFGLSYAKICTLLALKGQPFVNLYFHAWEFVDLKSFDLPFYVTKNTGKVMSKLLEKYIGWCLHKNLKFDSLQNCIKSINLFESRKRL